MSWAKIEIEFPPDTLDVNEVMAFLVDHFKHPSGVPTATITLVGAGGEEPPDDDWTPAAPRIRTTAPSTSSPTTSRALNTWPGNSTGRAPTSMAKGADELAAIHKTGRLLGASRPAISKIEAIKEFRAVYSVGLKEAKDWIDEAWKRAGI